MDFHPRHGSVLLITHSELKRILNKWETLGNLPEVNQNSDIFTDPETDIYGTGHNSVIKIPGKNELHIVYHRFSDLKCIIMGDATGYHREVAIDPLKFNGEGRGLRFNPTLDSIKPLGNR